MATTTSVDGDKRVQDSRLTGGLEFDRELHEAVGTLSDTHRKSAMQFVRFEGAVQSCLNELQDERGIDPRRLLTDVKTLIRDMHSMNNYEGVHEALRSLEGALHKTLGLPTPPMTPLRSTAVISLDPEGDAHLIRALEDLQSMASYAADELNKR